MCASQRQVTGRQVVKAAVRFEGPGRLPMHLPDKYGEDFSKFRMLPSVDNRPSSGVDEWGCVWENLGFTNLGEVKDHPLKSWDDLAGLNIPDVRDPSRWINMSNAREQAGDKFLLAVGVSLYERVHFLRGMENAWVDIHVDPDKLGELIDILVEMNLYAIDRYAQAGADGLMWCDDWGLQDRLMISPDDWHRIWKPRYARVYSAAHDAGLITFLHSCGNIVEILDDLIDAGLDVIQMDQQMNMGLELLGERFGGRITFMCPVDIQAVMPHGAPDEIRAYCRKMVSHLGTDKGGFIADWYSDPRSAGHSDQAIDAMCTEFVGISNGHADL